MNRLTETTFFQTEEYANRGLFLENVTAMYKTAEYCIKVYGGFTDPIESLLGLKKGCVLSPPLSYSLMT